MQFLLAHTGPRWLFGKQRAGILADINAKTIADGQTPMHMAINSRYEATVQLLLEKEVDINTKDYSGMTALHNTVMDQEEAMVHLLWKKGVESNAKNYRGYTAWYYMIMKGDEALVQLLLLEGADVHAKMIENGCTALHLAAGRGRDVMV